MSDTQTVSSLAALLSARPPAPRKARKGNAIDAQRTQNVTYVEDTGNEVNISEGETYMKGDNKGQPMSAEHVINTYKRKFEDRLTASGLMLTLVYWNINKEILPEDQWYALLSPLTVAEDAS